MELFGINVGDQVRLFGPRQIAGLGGTVKFSSVAWSVAQSKSRQICIDLLPSPLLGYCCNLGHHDALQIWRDRDEDTFKTPVKGVGFVLATTHCTPGTGRELPQAGSTWPQQGERG